MSGPGQSREKIVYCAGRSTDQQQPVMMAVDSQGGLIISGQQSDGFLNHSFILMSWPAAATQPTATKAATSDGHRHIITQISANISAIGAAQVQMSLVVRDGASGVGTILWQHDFGPVLSGDSKSIEVSGLNIIGTLDTDLTIEFTAAPTGTSKAGFSATGYDFPS